MKKTLFLFVFFFFFVSSVSAQLDGDKPTPTSSELSATDRQRMSNCDACGYCFLRADQPGVEVAQITQPVIPANWAQCRDCIYRGGDLKGKQAKDNLTLLGAPTPDQGYYFTQIGCVSTDAGGFTSALVGLFFRIVGGIAFLYLLYGAIVIATARGSVERLTYGRKILYGAIFGLMFALGAVFIISLISNGLGLGVSK